MPQNSPVVQKRAQSAKAKPSPLDNSDAASAHAIRIIDQVCCLAGAFDYVGELRSRLKAQGILAAIARHDSQLLFEWLVSTLSFQGIADQVARDYIEHHGSVAWSDLESMLSQQPSCPKLKSYWHFHSCGYKKGTGTCAQPDHIAQCPLPLHNLRNGHLNQLAYSLFFFIRDIAQGDFIGWIDGQLGLANNTSPSGPAARVRQHVLLDPLRNIYGVSDKVLTMALSMLLMSAGNRRPHWLEIGAGMIAIDTLVHNFLHRTGILKRFHAEHLYGRACYQPGGCDDIVRAVSQQIDARRFNPSFPKNFPRFIQHAVWRYCAASEFNICNGNRIDDRKPCSNIYCQIRSQCDKEPLYAE